MELVQMIQAFKSPASSYLEGVFARGRKYQSRLGTSEKETKNINPAHEDVVTFSGESVLAVLVSIRVLEIDYNRTQATDPRNRIFAVMHQVVSAPDERSINLQDIFIDAVKDIGNLCNPD
ncbi:hypothetical protein CTRI78_v008687 [Colletotrichum trifolii]|uniref:Uncharacterized protein n=1 Tax=Colletotrichum trifolii TaxID=5466 RepID=A0A4R8QUH9_COLTR|nr:hypothetical protein CTRI78_v008687 [Colletotrichum trifolii]